VGRRHWVLERFAALPVPDDDSVTKRYMDPPNIALYIAQLLGMCTSNDYFPLSTTMIGDIQDLHRSIICIVLINY
jgi:hypothetical protein